MCGISKNTYRKNQYTIPTPHGEEPPKNLPMHSLAVKRALISRAQPYERKTQKFCTILRFCLAHANPLKSQKRYAQPTHLAGRPVDFSLSVQFWPVTIKTQSKHGSIEPAMSSRALRALRACCGGLVCAAATMLLLPCPGG